MSKDAAVFGVVSHLLKNSPTQTATQKVPVSTDQHNGHYCDRIKDLLAGVWNNTMLVSSSWSHVLKKITASLSDTSTPTTRARAVSSGRWRT